MITIESLLEGWARWCAIRDDNGLGYASSGLNKLMRGEVIAWRGGESVLPYGIDVDSVYSKVDAAIHGLPDIHRSVLVRHYCRIGDDKAKAKDAGCCVRSYYRFLADAKAMLSGVLGSRCRLPELDCYSCC